MITKLQLQAYIDEMRAHFPFPDKLPAGDFSYLNICQTVARYLSPGAAILDFGSGPCDKTSLLSTMGYNCSACDDLRDNWHQEGTNREKIIEFAKNSGVKFFPVESGIPDFSAGTFDMVMLHDVIEHLHESPESLLTALIKVLKPGGYLFMTVPNAVNLRKRIAVLLGNTNLPPFREYYNYPGTWRGHIREYVKGDLKLLEELLGLKELELRGCDHLLEKVPDKLRQPYVKFTNIFDGLKDSLMLVAQLK